MAQSALSSQIRSLEALLGEALFDRVGRGLVLTEAGQLALSQAEVIFGAGRELLATFEAGRRDDAPLRIGAVATLSRNFQRSFVEPVLRCADAPLRIVTGGLVELLGRLEDHALDVVLSNEPPPANPRLHARLLARQPASIVSATLHRPFLFPDDLSRHAIILPGLSSGMRADFDALCERHGVTPRILAEVDDMATLRVLARDVPALVVVPSVVVRDELRQGLLHELCALPGVADAFHAITVQRRFQHPRLQSLLDRDASDLLAAFEDLPRG